MTQCERILQFLDEHGAITQADADMLRIKRLAARVLDLRRDGHNIISENITGKNEYGHWHCARYRRA